MRFTYQQSQGLFFGRTHDMRQIEAVMEWCIGEFGEHVPMAALRTKSSKPRWAFRLDSPPVETVDPRLTDDLEQFDSFNMSIVFTDTDWAARFRRAWRGRRADAAGPRPRDPGLEDDSRPVSPSTPGHP